MAIITFHSLEDRLVKQTMNELSKGCICPPELPVCVCGKKPIIKLITKKPLLHSEKELPKTKDRTVQSCVSPKKFRTRGNEMTTDVTKKKTITASEPNIKTGKHGGTSVPSKGRKPVNIARDRRVTGYTRVKSGELKRRTVVRTPDMSRPDAKVDNPQVSTARFRQR